MWLKEAFRRGGLEKPAGSFWYTFRRAWATERKDLPLKDVAAVGGWRDTSTLPRDQQPDEATMRKVAEFENSPKPSSPEQALSNSHGYSQAPQIGKARRLPSSHRAFSCPPGLEPGLS